MLNRSLKNTVFLCLLSLFMMACAQQSSSPNADGGASKPGPGKALSKQDQKIIDQLIADMVVIPAGEFQMGDSLSIGEDDEKPVHKVSVETFAMGRYEVTFEQYDVYVRATEGELPRDRWGRGRRPVIDVSWHDATDFADWLSQLTGKNIRLPSEAEWEYAARGNSAGRFAYGDDEALLCDYGNIADQSTDIGWRNKHCSDGFATTAPVGSFKPNFFGLYDMHGNVWEWLGDCWSRNYRGAPEDGSAWLSAMGCSERAQRGGSWFYGSEETRLTFRASGSELAKSVTLGFRLAQDVE